MSGKWYAKRHTAQEHGKSIQDSPECMDEINIWVTEASSAGVWLHAVCYNSSSIKLLLVSLQCKTFETLKEFTVFHNGDVNLPVMSLMETLWAFSSPHVYFHFHAYTVLTCEGDEIILCSTSLPLWLILHLRAFSPSQKWFFQFVCDTFGLTPGLNILYNSYYVFTLAPFKS